MLGRTSGENPTLALIEDLVLFLFSTAAAGQAFCNHCHFQCHTMRLTISSSPLLHLRWGWDLTAGSGSSTREAPLPVLTPTNSSSRIPLTSPRTSRDIRVPRSPYLRSVSASSPAGNLGRIWRRAKGCAFCLPAWGPLAFSPQGCFQHSWDLMQKPGEQKTFILCCTWALKHCQGTVGPGLPSSFELETDCFPFLSAWPKTQANHFPLLSPSRRDKRSVRNSSITPCPLQCPFSLGLPL